MIKALTLKKNQLIHKNKNLLFSNSVFSKKLKLLNFWNYFILSAPVEQLFLNSLITRLLNDSSQIKEIIFILSAVSTFFHFPGSLIQSLQYQKCVVKGYEIINIPISTNEYTCYVNDFLVGLLYHSLVSTLTMGVQHFT